VRPTACRLGAVLGLLGAAAGGGAQQLTLQTELQYRWVESTSADGSRTSYSQFTPLYLLNVRGPLFGGANIQANLGVTGMSSTDPHASVDQRNMRLDLTASSGPVDLFASLNRDTNRVSFAGATGGRTSLLATTDNLSVTAALNYPRHPSLTFQYTWGRSAFGDLDPLVTKTWLLAGNYTRGPLRLTADQSAQSLGEGSGTGRRSQYGLTYSRALLPAVDFSVEYSWVDATFHTEGDEQATRGSTTTARVTAYPTHAVVLEGEFGLTDGSVTTASDSTTGDTSSRRYSLDLRTEVLPGTQLDVFTRRRTFESFYGGSSNEEFAVDLDSRLDAQTTVSAQWSRSENRFGDSHFQRQSAGRLTVSSRLSRDTHLYAAASLNHQDNELGTLRTVSAEAGLSHELGPTLSLSAYYDYTRRRNDQSGTELTDTIHSVTLDGRWAPDQSWDVRAGVGLTSRESTRSSWSVNPYAEVRWSPSYATTLTLRQYANVHSERRRIDGGEPLDTTRSSAGFAARLAHQFSEQESFQISFQADEGLGGALDAQKLLQVTYVRSF
jgi:hypothetical protein